MKSYILPSTGYNILPSLFPIKPSVMDLTSSVLLSTYNPSFFNSKALSVSSDFLTLMRPLLIVIVSDVDLIEI